MSTPPKDQPVDELHDFLATLKVHNKDLSACFNDAVAVAHLEQLIQAECNRARIEVCEAVLSASDKPKNKGFAGTWYGDMAAACGEVATQYKKAKRELQQIIKGRE